MAELNPIDSVLEAEKQAEAEKMRKHDEANQIVSDALSQARVIAERTSTRITKIHAHCAENAKNKCDAMWKAYEQEPEPLSDTVLTSERLAKVLEHVAATLSGGDDE